MTQVLPPRPSLVRLKKQAKQFLKQYRDGNHEALEQVRLFFPFPDRFKNLRDAQLVIARSYGYAGWTDLVHAVDEILLNALSPAELADQLVDLACLQYSGQDTDLRFDRAARILRKYPELAQQNLITAIVSNNLNRVTTLLDTDPSLAITVVGPRHWQPLMYLAYNRIPETGTQKNALAIARLLLEHGADPNSYVMLQECYRFTVLAGVMGEGEGGVVNQPPHQYAPELARLLLQAGADPNESQGLYNTVFTDSGPFWLPLLVEFGLNKESCVNWDSGENPCRMFDFLLDIAASRNFISRIDYLLELGADPNARSMYSERNVYTVALTSGHTEIARRLLEAGAKPEVLSVEDQFLIAVNHQDQEKIKSLVAQNQDVLDHPEFCQNANEQALSLLLSLGLNMDHQDSHGKCLLHYMAAIGNLEGVRFLLEQGAREDLRDHQYHATALGWAHFNHQAEVRNYLIGRTDNTNELAACGELDRLKQVLRENGILARQCSESGNTPLHLVCNWLGATADVKLRAEMMDVLLQHGADINAVNRNGLSPLGLNRQENIMENVTLLLKRGAC